MTAYAHNSSSHTERTPALGGFALLTNSLPGSDVRWSVAIAWLGRCEDGGAA